MKLYQFLLLTILFLLTSFVYKNVKVYQTKFNSSNFAYLYAHSQFASDPKERKFIIRDHDLYAYAGWYYLKTGELDTINIEHPPLGKYLIGLSIFIFNNQNIGQIFWGILFLVLLFYLNKAIIKNNVLALLPVFLFCQEKIFKEQLTYSLLDLSLGVFLLIFFLAVKNQSKKKKILLLVQGISLGAVASIKYPTIALIALATLTVYYFLKKEKEIIKKLVLITSIAAVIFLLSYLPFFLKNPNFISFYNLQVKALKIHLSHVPEYPKGQVFNVLFFNRWLSWWGEKNYIKTEFWNLFWPILTVNFFLTFFKFKKNLLINLWTLFYLLFLSSRLFFPRYLFLLIPFFYIQLGYKISILYKHHCVV